MLPDPALPAVKIIVLHGGGPDSLYHELNDWLTHGEGRALGVEIANETSDPDLMHLYVRNDKPECIVFDANHFQSEVSEKTIRAWRRNAQTAEYPGPGVVGVVCSGDVGTATWLRKLGVEEIYERPANRPGIVSQINNAISTRNEVNADRVVIQRIEVPVGNMRILAPVVAVAGIGGSGKTLLSLCMASMLQFIGNFRTCLVDMASTNPAVHHYLGVHHRGDKGLPNIIMGLQPEGDLIRRQRETIEANVVPWKPPHFSAETKLDLILGYHSYLTVIDEVDARWTTPLMRRLVQTLRMPQAYSNIVIDLGDGLYHPGEKGALLESDVILIPISPRRGIVEATGRYVNDLFEILGLDPDGPDLTVGAVLNGAGQPGALSEREIRAVLPRGVEFWGSLPWAPNDIENALRVDSLPVLTDENSLFTKAISSLVHSHIAPLPQEVHANRGRLSTWFRKSA